MARGRPRKNHEVEPQVPSDEMPVESEVVPESPSGEVDLNKIPSKYHKFQKGEK